MNHKDYERTIWTDYNIDPEDYRDIYPDLTDDELTEKVYDSIYQDLDDIRMSFNVKFNDPILIIGDLGLWNGRRQGYKEIKTCKLSDCFSSDADYNTWYVDKNGDFRCEAVHHDGTNYYTYRVWKHNTSERQRERLRNKLYYGEDCEADIARFTSRIGPVIGDRYGWYFTGRKAKLW